jgi:hypothetical protein
MVMRSRAVVWQWIIPAFEPHVAIGIHCCLSVTMIRSQIRWTHRDENYIVINTT